MRFWTFPIILLALSSQTSCVLQMEHALLPCRNSKPRLGLDFLSLINSLINFKGVVPGAANRLETYGQDSNFVMAGLSGRWSTNCPLLCFVARQVHADTLLAGTEKGDTAAGWESGEHGRYSQAGLAAHIWG